MMLQLLNFEFQLAQADINIERETYQQSRSGLNEMYLQVKRQFDTEVEHRKVHLSIHLLVIEMRIQKDIICYKI